MDLSTVHSSLAVSISIDRVTFLRTTFPYSILGASGQDFATWALSAVCASWATFYAIESTSLPRRPAV